MAKSLSLIHICLQHLDVFTEAQSLGDIFGVEDQSGMLLYKGIVNIGVSAGDHDEIGILQQLAAQLDVYKRQVSAFSSSNAESNTALFSEGNTSFPSTKKMPDVYKRQLVW